MTRPTTYVLFFRNTGPETHAQLTEEQRRALGARWNAWFDALVEEGKASEGQPLDVELHRVVRGSGGASVMDGPFAEAKETVGGYVKLTVPTLEEATEIAQRHPGLEHGLIIEVRAPLGVCHLGCSGDPASRQG